MRRLVPALAALALAATSGVVASGATAPPLVDDPTAYVDPMIGTSGDGFTVPGPATPFGMTMVSPDTTGPFAYTGYWYTDPQIRGFSLLHIDAAGTHIGADLPFMPVVGPVTSTDPTEYAVPFSHATEHASAGAYDVTLGNGVAVDLAATAHGGLERFTPPTPAGLSVIADVGRNAADVHDSSVAVVGSDRLEGVSTEHWRGGDYVTHFSARFSRPFTSVQTFVGSTLSSATAAQGTGAGAVLAFAGSEPVTMAVAVSFVDLDGARRNLAAELPGFDVGAVQRQARAAWRSELSRVRIGGGSSTELRTFYTALYHTLLHPDVDSDVDGRYAGPDGAVHTSAAGHPHYENFSLWDTIRGENALLATLVPDRYADMVTSLSAFAAQAGGVLPLWSFHSAHPDYMIGDPAIPTLAEAVCRGLDGLDVDTLYAQARHLAFDLRPADYLRLGYSPGSASETLEYADADFSLALMAERLGHADDAAALRERARAWTRLFKDGFLQPRAADGSFPASYDPRAGDGYREGTGWQYRWLAPHDQGGLVAANGGRAAYASALDAFFSVPAATTPPGTPVVPQVQSAETVFGINYYGDQYVPGNEHDLEAPYLYDWTDRPSTTQAVVSSERSLFLDNPLGLPGNDDLGALSAWYVWAALGFYPVVPGAPVFVMGAPLFPRAEIRLGGDRPFVVTAPGASARTPYISTADLNGRSLERSWFTAGALHPGGSLRLVMGGSASSWASDASAAPPSLSTTGTSSFGCTSQGASS